MENISIMAFFKSAIALIPESIWAAALAAFMAFFGVAMSNKNHRQILFRQLEHDSLENDKERKLAIRKDVYLRLAEEMVKAYGYIGSLGQVNIAKKNIHAELIGFQAIANQASLISQPETSYLIINLNKDLSLLIMDLIPSLGRISVLMGAIETQDKFYDRSQEEIQRVLSDRGRMREMNDPDAARFKELGHSFDFHMKSADQYSRERNKLALELNNLIINFGLSLIEKLEPIAEQQVHILVALRSEMGIESDLKKYTDLLSEQRKQISQKAHEAFDLLKCANSEER
jgi:hypothetical protein